MCSRVGRRPLISFTVIAYGLTWALLPIAHHHVWVGVLALACPALAAVIVARSQGSAEQRALFTRIRQWRVPARWYVVALIVPVPASYLASVIEQAFGVPGPITFVRPSLLGAVVFVMVLGEEIGWRGFALPQLRRRFDAVTASVILGLIWAVWHLPLFYMSSMPQYGSPFSAYVVYTIALSIVFTILADRTSGSVIIATLFHGAVNTFVFVNHAASPVQRGWGNAIAYGVAAVVMLGIWKATGSRRDRPARARAAPPLACRPTPSQSPRRT